MPEVQVAGTAAVPAPVLVSARRLMGTAWPAGGFTADDWAHALGGVHAWVEDPARVGVVLAHGSLVPRTLWVGDRALDVGYVEAVAVDPSHRRRGLGSAVMEGVEGAGRRAAYDLLALAASEDGLALYRDRGWIAWRGPTGVRRADGDETTPDCDGAVLVRPGRLALGGIGSLDLGAPLWCDPREGDDW